MLEKMCFFVKFEEGCRNLNTQKNIPHSNKHKKERGHTYLMGVASFLYLIRIFMIMRKFKIKLNLEPFVAVGKIKSRQLFYFIYSI